MGIVRSSTSAPWSWSSTTIQPGILPDPSLCSTVELKVFWLSTWPGGHHWVAGSSMERFLTSVGTNGGNLAS